MPANVTLVQVDLSGDLTIIGQQAYDRANNGVLIPPFVATAAARNALTPAFGEIVWQEDTSELYRWDGSAWVSLTTASITFEKAGTLIAGAFSGSPLKATLAFATAYGDANYAVAVEVVSSAGRSFAPIIESKTALGFTINLCSSNNFGLTEVLWTTTPFKDL